MTVRRWSTDSVFSGFRHADSLAGTSRSAQLSPAESARTWAGNTGTERAASQEHFIDLCRVLGVPTPNAAAELELPCLRGRVRTCAGAAAGGGESTPGRPPQGPSSATSPRVRRRERYSRALSLFPHAAMAHHWPERFFELS